MFVKEPVGEVPIISSRVAEDMPNKTITEEDVIVDIKSINKNKSCGPDEIDVRMLHELLDFMSKPITALLKKSLSTGVLPKDWLAAVLTPVFKRSNRDKAEKSPSSRKTS